MVTVEFAHLDDNKEYSLRKMSDEQLIKDSLIFGRSDLSCIDSEPYIVELCRRLELKILIIDSIEKYTKRLGRKK